MILDDIIRLRRQDLEQQQHLHPESALRSQALYAEERRGFATALRKPGRRIIAEVKKASPSRGVIRSDFDPIAIARAYAANGATAISVLTEERHFQGSGAYLAAIRSAVDCPLLRKDFIVDPYQIVEARALGADAILLILAALDDTDFQRLLQTAEKEGLDVLVEVHDEDELRRALAFTATLIGINNRDLRTFVTSLEVTERLMTLVPSGTNVVAESGIEGAADLRRLESCGVRVFLIGETLMRAADPGAKLRELTAT